MDPTPETPSLGRIIRRQRQLNELTLRQFASMVGISNPYLSQIERGLREPSEKVVEAIARSLRLSADALYEQAGRSADPGGAADAAANPVVEAIQADPALTPRQRQSLIEVYESFAGQGDPGRRRARP